MIRPPDLAALTAVAVAATLSLLACTGPSENFRPPETGRDGSAIARPYYAGEPSQAVAVTPDPQRDAVTNRLTAGFRDRITDLTYLAVVGEIKDTEPDRLGLYLAHRENHDACLRAILDQAAVIAQTPVSQEELAAELSACLRRAAGDWTAAPPSERSLWLRRVLEAAGRVHNPARHYAALHPKPEISETYREMSQVYQQCENLAPYHADLAAVSDDPATVSPALERAVNDIGHCMATATGIAWPVPPPPTRAPPVR